MATFYQIPRGTKANLDTLAASSGLIQYQSYWLTDSQRIAIATATNSYMMLPNTNEQTGQITFVFDGGGVAIAANHTVDLPDFPYNATITGWTITSDVSTTSVVTVSRATYANFPTFTEISGSEDPSLTAAQKNQDLTLSSWTTALTQGDSLRAVVTSNNNAKRLSVTVRFSRS